ncbi:MAG: FRG domain-containing protein [Rikenellaceae bacterium]|jgi:hypothetical protein|nr:FRG domain-containing protein [Rikenellaceae bacterium]
MDWNKKREELIDKLPTLLDLLNHWAFGEEKGALQVEKSHFKGVFPTHVHQGMFDTVRMPDGYIRLVPMSLAFNAYYRGQSSYYADCKPALYRKGMSEDDIFVERLKACELQLLIETYPMYHIFLQGIAVNYPDGRQKPIRFAIDTLALAQHYGIKTELVDLTCDKWVAAFFAATDYDSNTDTYHPVIDKHRYGIMYHYWDITTIGFEKTYLRAVGLQPFSRPGEQAGFVLELAKDENLNRLKSCEKIKFRHDARVSELIFNYTNRGNKLFPKDILDGKALIIRNNDKNNKDSVIHFSHDAYNMAKEIFYPDMEEAILSDYMKKQKITLSHDRVVAFTEEEKEQCYKNWEQTKEDFFSKINVSFSYMGDSEWTI